MRKGKFKFTNKSGQEEQVALETMLDQIVDSPVRALQPNTDYQRGEIVFDKTRPLMFLVCARDGRTGDQRSLSVFNGGADGDIKECGTAAFIVHVTIKLPTQAILEQYVTKAAITPAVYHDVSDFRHHNTAYVLGDKVRCMFNFELFLECTKAGTTSADPLDTRNVNHGQVLTDGTVQWTVRTHIKSVNGVVAGADGDVPIDIPKPDLSKYVPVSDVGNKANKIPKYSSDGHLVLPNGAEFWIA